jgi:hypothetical protein
MGRTVIAAYKPKEGMQQRLEEIVSRHTGILRAQGLVTDKPAIAMRAADGTIVEVFEWSSPKAIEEAHRNPAVQAMWREFGEAAEFVPIAGVAESRNLFSEFESLPS